MWWGWCSPVAAGARPAFLYAVHRADFRGPCPVSVRGDHAPGQCSLLAARVLFHRVSIPPPGRRLGAGMTWFKAVVSEKWHALIGVPWAGLVTSLCGREFHLEDIEDERDHVEASRACRQCLRAAAQEQEK